MGQPLANSESSTIERGGIAEEHVREVGAKHQGVELVCQLGEVLSWVDLALGLRLPYDIGNFSRIREYTSRKWSLTGPALASSSAAAATKRDPPGKTARSRYDRKASHTQRTRRAPGGAARPAATLHARAFRSRHQSSRSGGLL